MEFGLGVGRSGLPEHYRGFNIAYGESRERFFETLVVLHRLPALREAIPFSSLSAWMSPGGKIPDAQALTSMRLFADRVIPRLTRRAGGFALGDPK
ncbi:MAG: hypothetical protein HY217_11735 [Candidatus Rokubacteria bacterium]|nr:hypothetical protein [Candidatus Rokubacteria bacterium]